MAAFKELVDHGDMTRIAILLSVQALLLGGCAFLQEPGEPPPGDSGAMESVEASEGPAAPAPSPSRAASTSETGSPTDAAGAAVTASPRPVLSAEPLRPSASGAVLAGTLGFDAVEGGCAYLETTGGKRYEVIYPDGWRIDRATGHLIGPIGQDARPGDVVTVRGSVTTEMASICQVGLMFRAVEVVSVGG